VIRIAVLLAKQQRKHRFKASMQYCDKLNVIPKKKRLLNSDRDSSGKFLRAWVASPVCVLRGRGKFNG